MILSGHDVWRPSKADFARWGACMLAVLGLHGAAVFWLRDVNPPKIGFPVTTPPILIELAPVTATPPPPPEPFPSEQRPRMDLPPSPEPALPPRQEESATAPDAALPVPKLPPVKRPPPPRPVVRQPPLVAQAAAPPVLTPPTSGPAAPIPAAPPRGVLAAHWESAVAAYIARFRQYPVLAQRRGEEGIALVHFVVDRAGNVSSVTLIRGSGHPDLDREATAWVARAQPVPPPPPEITQSRIELMIPLRFELH
jgi:protein TonB